MKRLALLVLLAARAFAHDLEGYVFAPDGNVVAKAAVSAYAPGTRELLKTTATDGGGRFKLTALPESLIEVEASLDGATTQTVTALPNDPPLTLTLIRASRTVSRTREKEAVAEGGRRQGEGVLTGTIRIDRKPMRGVTVQIEPMSDLASPSLTVVTDAQGRYRATGLAPSRYMIQVAPGLEWRIRTPWSERMFDERNAPNIADLGAQRAATLDVDLTRVPFITGRVTDHEGKPVAGAEVRLFVENAPALDLFHEPNSPRTLPDGRYAVTAPPFEPERRVQILVARPRHAIVRSKPFVLGEGGQKVDVVLPQFEPVTVRVTGDEAKPLRGATVTFAAAGERANPEMSRIVARGPSHRSITTNESGEATLELTPGEYDFIVSADGHQTRTISDRIKRGTVVDVALERSYSIKGRVHRRGTGVADVQVMILGNRREVSTSTANDGTFEITGLARATYPLQFFKHEELIDRAMEVEAPATVDVELAPSGTIRGTVIDAATRERVREFQLSVVPLEAERNTNARRRGPASLERNEVNDGTFTASVPVGSYSVTIGSLGYRTTDAVTVRVTEEKAAVVEIALDRGATVTGRVTDENGAPMREAPVWVVLDAPPVAHSRTRNAPVAMQVNTRTDQNGEFSLSGIEPGPATLIVRVEGYVQFRRTFDADGVSRIDIRLSRGLTVTGTVTHDGRPAADVHVDASTAAIESENQFARTDEAGRFVMTGLIAARYTFSAFKEGSGQVEVPNVDVARQREVAIELTSAPRGTIFGTVTGVPGTAAKVVRRAVIAEGETYSAEGMIDEAGNYRIEKAPTGTVFVTAHIETTGGGRTSSRKQIEVAPRQEVRADLDFGGSVVVRGRITREGRPVSAGRIVFTSASNVIGTATLRDDGTYEVSLGEPGVYRLFVNSEDMRARGFQTVRTIRGDETIDLEMREQVVEGTVIDAESRQPIAGAIVTLAPQQGLREHVSGETVTDANGRFTILTAADGPHTLTASARGYAYRIVPFSLATNRPPPVTFELGRAGELRIRTIDARTRATLAAQVTLTDERGTPLPVRGDQSPSDATWIFSLPEGKYRVTAIVHGYAAKTVEVTAPGTVEVAME